MDAATARYLNAINQAFYATTAASFDATRGRAWPGWQQLVACLPPGAFDVLDVGCGNGRFGVFLRDEGRLAGYHGLDSSAELLARARMALPDAELTRRDIIEQPPDTGLYDLVVLFGVIHHVPGAERRRALLRTLAARVRPGGHLAFAAWRFYEYERFQERIQPWPDTVTVEAHDYLLDWRREVTAQRYCHYVDDAEHAALIAASGLAEVCTYRADGQDNRMNQYSVLVKGDPGAPG